MRNLIIFLFTISLLCSDAALAIAGERSLYWKALDVTALLDAGGRLHVTERQEMVFSGDWNGGERTFRVTGGQKLDFKGITRIDPATGRKYELKRGSLGKMDHYDWGEGNSLRWRSRLPDSPPFLNTRITYVLEYTLSNILVAKENGFVLNHDFAFPDRLWPINSFSLDLRFDPSWLRQESGPVRLDRGRLAPGESVILDIPMVYAGKGRPASVLYGAPPSVRGVLSLIVFTAPLFLAAAFFFREWRRGRYSRLVPVSRIDRPWLEKSVLRFPPEVIGHLWDNHTGAPEVAAILARMVTEKKLASRVETRRSFLLFKRNVLHMKLLVDQDSLKGYEADLVRAFFRPGEKTTDSDGIRKRYSATGFNPAARISDPLQKKAQSMVGETSKKKGRLWILTAILFLAGIALLTSAGVTRHHEIWKAVLGFGIGLAAYIAAYFFIHVYRMSITWPFPRSIPFISIILAMGMALHKTLLAAAGPESALLLSGLTTSFVSLSLSLFNQARTSDSREKVLLRRDLAAARRFMKYELWKKSPNLDDNWYPYLIALELGKPMDRWFRVHGARSASRNIHGSMGSSGTGTVTAQWSGGGGTFGGAGASASWAAAVGVLAAGVAKPSSSGSGSSGGGGGSSSGGGGGGGW